MPADARPALALEWSGPADAPVLVLANSLATDSRLWDGVLAALSRHRRPVRIARFDYRGHGRQPAADDGPCRIERIADDVVAALDRAGVDRFHVAGVSMGGAVAMTIAAVHAPRVQGVLLANTALRFGPADVWERRIDTARREGLHALADTTIARWLTEEVAVREPGLRSALREMFLATDVGGYVRACSAVRDFDGLAQAARITAPTWVYAGRQDEATPPALGREIARHVDGSRYVERAGAHLGPVCDPAGIADLLLQLLDGNRDAAHH